MNNHLLLSALRARYRVLLFILVLTVLVAAAVTSLLPKTYIATAAMLVDNKADQSMSVTMSDLNVRERIGYLQTQVDIITSEKVARRVVRELDLLADPDAHANLPEVFEAKNAIEDRLIAVLLKRVKVDTSQSSVITIAFPARDPRFAALIANGFAKAYLNTALELRVEPSRQTAAWFDEQMQTLRANLEQAMGRLAAYQREKGVVTLDERLDADSLAAGTLSQATLAGTIRRQPADLMAAARGTTLDDGRFAAWQRANAQLGQAEARLRELGARLGDNHPAYRSQLAVTQSLRAEASRLAVRPVARVDHGESDGAAARQAQQARVQELREYRSQLAVLTRDVDISQKAYETALQRSLDKKVESRASMTNVSILYSAAIPFKAARPRTDLNLALAAIVGTLLGLCTIYLMEFFDRRVRSVEDLDNEWNVPLLAELRASPLAQGRLLAGPASSHVLPAPE